MDLFCRPPSSIFFSNGSCLMPWKNMMANSADGIQREIKVKAQRCYRRLLNISYKDHATNEEVHRKIQASIGEYDELLILVKKRKLRWFSHVSRFSGLANTILQGTVKVKRKRGREKKRWKDNIKEWTGVNLPAQLGQLASFKYLGAVLSDDDSKSEVLPRIAQATSALTKMKPIWNDNNISLGSKVKLMRSLVISIFALN